MSSSDLDEALLKYLEDPERLKEAIESGNEGEGCSALHLNLIKEIKKSLRLDKETNTRREAHPKMLDMLSWDYNPSEEDSANSSEAAKNSS